MPDALVVVDMQAGMLDGPPKHDLAGVIGRINALAAMVRSDGGTVVWIRHCGKAGDGFAPHEPGWAFLPELDYRRDDVVVDKTLNDSFAGTALQETLQAMAPDRVRSQAGPPTSASTPRYARRSRATITSWWWATAIRSATAPTSPRPR